jgi:hypothetical protein
VPAAAPSRKPDEAEIAWRAVLGQGTTPADRALSALTEAIQMGVLAATPAAAAPAAAPGRTMSTRVHHAFTSPLRTPVLIGAAVMGLILMGIITGLVYFGLTGHELARHASRSLSAQKADVTLVVPQSSSSGAMRGNRWQIVPGGFGGFSAPQAGESY